MDNYQANESSLRTRCCSRGLVGPVVLITLGVLFMLSEFNIASFHRTWPILLIMIGLMKVLGGNLGSSGEVDVMAPPPAVPPPPGSAPQNPESRQVDHV